MDCNQFRSDNVSPDDSIELKAKAIVLSRAAAKFNCANEIRALKSRVTLYDFLNSPDTFKEFKGLISAVNQRVAVKKAEEDVLRWSKNGITFSFHGEEGYPTDLLHIEDPPLLLFQRGLQYNLNHLTNTVSIVGARRAERDSLFIAENLARSFAESGLTVISGLALGVDAAAHRGALNGRGTPSTIAVLGNGLSNIYPATNDALGRGILNTNGVLLSQFEPDEPAFPANFLNRNRIIAALSKCTLVIQASARSGSLVTAKYALEYGKELFVVPGGINKEGFKGSNELIKYGANIFTSIEDILSLYPNLSVKKSVAKEVINLKKISELSQSQREIMQKLEVGDSFYIDDLLNSLTEKDKFFDDILDLELEGLIRREPGNYIVAC